MVYFIEKRISEEDYVHEKKTLNLLVFLFCQDLLTTTASSMQRELFLCTDGPSSPWKTKATENLLGSPRLVAMFFIFPIGAMLTFFPPLLKVVVKNIRGVNEPIGTKGIHVTRTIAFNDEGELFISVGAATNVDDDNTRAVIFRCPSMEKGSLTNGGLDAVDECGVFTKGNRNEVGLAFDHTGQLW